VNGQFFLTGLTGLQDFPGAQDGQDLQTGFSFPFAFLAPLRLKKKEAFAENQSSVFFLTRRHEGTKVSKKYPVIAL